MGGEKTDQVAGDPHRRLRVKNNLALYAHFLKSRGASIALIYIPLHQITAMLAFTNDKKGNDYPS